MSWFGWVTTVQVVTSSWTTNPVFLCGLGGARSPGILLPGFDTLMVIAIVVYSMVENTNPNSVDVRAIAEENDTEYRPEYVRSAIKLYRNRKEQGRVANPIHVE